MSFYIEHPDEWIGVPEYWPFPTPQGGIMADAGEWADAVVDGISGDDPDALSPEARARIIALLLLAARRGERAGARVFVAFEGWDGPAYIVEAVTEPKSVLGSRTLEQFAGVDDPDQVGPPFGESFVTESGLIGARSYRYLPLAEEGVIYARADYVFAEGDVVLSIRGMESDLVFFEKLKPELAALAGSVSWRG